MAILFLASATAYLFLPSALSAPSPPIIIPSPLDPISPFKKYYNSLPPSLQTTYTSQIGDTPLLELRHLSSLLTQYARSLSQLSSRLAPITVKLYAKQEHKNPGGTGKDRLALALVAGAHAAASVSNLRLSHIVEGSSGSTGISLSAICGGSGIPCTVVVPDDQSPAKGDIMKAFGASLHVVKTASISNPNHYVNYGRVLAKELNADKSAVDGLAVFTDQFESPANYDIHYTTTGPELYLDLLRATRSSLPPPLLSFVMSSGTGGTLSGVGNFLKSAYASLSLPPPITVCADCQGSVLYNSVTHGVAFTCEQAERRLKKHRHDTICEGIGLDRLTYNFSKGDLDRAETVTDQEVVDCCHFLVRREGVFVGSSSALNVVAAVREAKRRIKEELGRVADSRDGERRASCEDIVVVTVLCDEGQRHLHRLWNRDFIESEAGGKLKWPETNISGEAWDTWLLNL